MATSSISYEDLFPDYDYDNGEFVHRESKQRFAIQNDGQNIFLEPITQATSAAGTPANNNTETTTLPLISPPALPPPSLGSPPASQGIRPKKSRRSNDKDESTLQIPKLPPLLPPQVPFADFGIYGNNHPLLQQPHDPPEHTESTEIGNIPPALYGSDDVETLMNDHIPMLFKR
eukprot:scaffold7522_cov34-Cyclotella_meneghiniana.AAC.2